MLRTLKLLAGAALLLALLAPASSRAAASDDLFLSGPSSAAPADIALDYVDSHKAELGLVQGDLVDLIVRDEVRTRHNGVTHVYLQQRLGGVEVVNGILNVNVMPDGRILSLGNRFAGDLAQRATAVSPSLQPEAAVTRAAEHLGLSLGEDLVILEVVGGPSMGVRFDTAGLSKEEIPVGLMYLPIDDRGGPVHLAWSVVIQPLVGSDWWNVFVDTETGTVLRKFNLTVNDKDRLPIGLTAGRPGPVRRAEVEEATQGCTNNCYRVFALPLESPDQGPRTVDGVEHRRACMTAVRAGMVVSTVDRRAP
jgi:Zn-dependent metalloprotease